MVNSWYMFSLYLVNRLVYMVLPSPSSTCWLTSLSQPGSPPRIRQHRSISKMQLFHVLLGRKKTHRSIYVLAPQRSKATDRPDMGSSNAPLESFRPTPPRRLLEFREARPAMDAQYISRQNHQATDTDWGAAASVTPAMGGRGGRFEEKVQIVEGELFHRGR